jgi:hypothetical protein
MAKKNFGPYMAGGLLLGGLYLLTKNNNSLGPAAAARQSVAQDPSYAGVTPGLFHYISESTEWNDYQIVKTALAPDVPTIIVPYTYNETVSHLMARGMPQEVSESEATKIRNQAYPSVVNRLENLYNRRNMTVGDRREIYAHLLPVYNVMETPNGQRVPLPGGTVSTTTPTAESVQGMAIRQNIAGHYNPGVGINGTQSTNLAGNRRSRTISGMHAWTKDAAGQIYDQREISATREMTLRNMKSGMDINLYAPVDTLDIMSETPKPTMNQVENVGSAFVKTRGAMRRLL